MQATKPGRSNHQAGYLWLLIYRPDVIHWKEVWYAAGIDRNIHILHTLSTSGASIQFIVRADWLAVATADSALDTEDSWLIGETMNDVLRSLRVCTQHSHVNKYTCKWRCKEGRCSVDTDDKHYHFSRLIIIIESYVVFSDIQIGFTLEITRCIFNSISFQGTPAPCPDAVHRCNLSTWANHQ